MAEPTNTERLQGVLSAKDPADSAKQYDDWAHAYEEDMYAAGYRTPSVVCGLLAKHVAPEDGPILDLGCGSGVGAELLHLLGFKDIVGVDGAPRMLERAEKKGLYRALHEAVLDGNTRLPYEDNTFAGLIGLGILIPNHAPPETLDELVRVVKPGGVLIYNVGANEYAENGFKEKHEALEKEGKWTCVDGPVVYRSVPLAVDSFKSQVAVYKVK